jgi:hypothetical protein
MMSRRKLGQKVNASDLYLDVADSNLGQDTNYPRKFLWFSSVFRDGYLDNNSHHITATPFRIPSKSYSLVILPFYTIWSVLLTEWGQLNLYSEGLRTGWQAFYSRQGQDFSLLRSLQTGSEAHPASYPVGTGGSFLGGKTAGAWS